MAQTLSLLSFPDELLISILSHLAIDLPTLSALSWVCKKLQDLAEPLIYASILITKGSQTQRLVHALDARKERMRYVHALGLRCRYTQTEGMSLMKSLLPRLEHLKELSIESPWCNHSSASPSMWDEEVESYARIFSNAPLFVSPQTLGHSQPLVRLRSCQ